MSHSCFPFLDHFLLVPAECHFRQSFLRNLAFQAKELQEWADNPEAFHHEADLGAWQDHLRSCAEALLAGLLEVSLLTQK
jgi:cyclopropane fatty-acyl-phospholipid synthase-like methyltransferase